MLLLLFSNQQAGPPVTSYDSMEFTGETLTQLYTFESETITPALEFTNETLEPI